MSELSLESCWARFGRAEEHGKALRKAMEDYFRSGPYGFAHQVNSDRTRFSLVAKIFKPPDLLSWSLILCDALNGLRCSLDHLVWAVGVKEEVLALPDPPKPHAIAFPIAKDPYAFSSQAGKCIKGFSAEVREAIEHMQPYNRRHPHLRPLLELLQEIDNKNKHQLLRVALALFNGGDIRNLSYPIKPKETITVVASTAEMTDGAEAVAVILREPYEKDVTFDFRGHIAIGLPVPPGPNSHVKWAAIHLLVDEMTAEVRSVIKTVAAAA